MSRKKQGAGILSIKPIGLTMTSDVHSQKKKPIKRVGQTGNFVVDYDSTESLILVYGKEVPASHKFKLGLDKSEATAMINLLKQAKTLFDNFDKA